MNMRISTRTLVAGLAMALATGSIPALAQMSSGMGAMGSEHAVMVGGAAMYPSRNIVQNAVHSKDHTTLVAAVKAAGLVKTLESPGPFTVFAPTNEAFAALPAGTAQNLLKPESKAELTRILTYHVVAGRLDTDALDAKIAAGGGEAKLKTVEGDRVTVKGSGTHLTVTDDKGNTADITIPNVHQSSGVIMVINKVLMP
ncbi:MAG: fasciclin domain-containing protein [Rhodanobacteraceae bacterium]|nr:MAG: fasciclin domain-containing protein [Rhodanobacteraceae bacterium]